MSAVRPRRKLVIAFDCDDVLVPTSYKLLEAYNIEHGTQVDLRYLYEEHVSWGVSKSEAVERVLDLHRRRVVAGAVPMSEVIDEVNRLANAGHELHVITGRHEFQFEDTMLQLNTYFPGVFKTVEFTSYFGHSARGKGDVCRQLGVDIFIDDHIYHCNRVAQAGVATILYGNYPWNSACSSLADGIRRAQTMREVRKEVERVVRA